MLGTSVLTPTLRYHPSVVAQAFATLGVLAPGRVFLGVGTGEAMNETPATGAGVPGPQGAPPAARRGDQADPAALDRGARGLRGRVVPDLEGDDLRPARGAGADLRGRVRAARGQAGRPRSATASSARAARTRRSTTALLAKVAEGAEAAGRDPGDDPAHDRGEGLVRPRPPVRARRRARWWAALALTPEQKEGVEDPIEMERLADENADRAPTRFIVSDDPEEIAAGIRHYADLGFDELVLHAPGEDQARFLDQFARTCSPAPLTLNDPQVDLVLPRHGRLAEGPRHVHVGRQPRDRARHRHPCRARRREGRADGEDRRAPSQARPARSTPPPRRSRPLAARRCRSSATSATPRRSRRRSPRPSSGSAASTSW